MFNDFYNFKSNPFSETPNTNYFFKSKEQTLALRSMANMIDMGQGIGVLIGEVGTGKTILSRVFLKICNEKFNTGLLLYPQLKGIDLLKAINEELGVEKSDKNRSYFHQKKQLSKHLSELARNGKPSLLVIDEAQHMTLEGLESLCLLNNMEFESKKLLHIILSGQPELRQTLNQPRLEPLRKRISSAISLGPMNLSEVSDYIHHRIFIAGGSNYVRFESSAINLISKYSDNIPRLINIICQHSIEIGYDTQTRTINESIVKMAIKICPQINHKKAHHWMERVLPL